MDVVVGRLGIRRGTLVPEMPPLVSLLVLEIASDKMTSKPKMRLDFIP